MSYDGAANHGSSLERAGQSAAFIVIRDYVPISRDPRAEACIKLRVSTRRCLCSPSANLCLVVHSVGDKADKAVRTTSSYSPSQSRLSSIRSFNHLKFQRPTAASAWTFLCPTMRRPERFRV